MAEHFQNFVGWLLRSDNPEVDSEFADLSGRDVRITGHEDETDDEDGSERSDAQHLL